MAKNEKPKPEPQPQTPRPKPKPRYETLGATPNPKTKKDNG